MNIGFCVQVKVSHFRGMKHPIEPANVTVRTKSTTRPTQRIAGTSPETADKLALKGNLELSEFPTETGIEQFHAMLSPTHHKAANHVTQHQKPSQQHQQQRQDRPMHAGQMAFMQGMNYCIFLPLILLVK